MNTPPKGIHGEVSVKTYVIFLAIITFFALVIRVIGLNRVPPGISTDVLLYFSNARAIAETGKDIYGRVFPLYSSHKGFLVSPVTMYAIALVYKIFGFSHVISYVPNIVLATASIVFCALLATKLIGNRRIGLISALLVAVSPWHYHLSRTGFEGVFGFSLVLIGIYCSVMAIKRPAWYIVSFVLFVLATFSYKAINVFLVLYPILFFLTVAKKLVKMKYVIVFTLGIWIVIAFQWFMLFAYYHDTYSNGFVSNNITRAKLDSDTERLQSDAPHLVRIIASNVPLSLSRILFANYAHFFSPQYLLTLGDNDLRYSTGGQGQIYLVDAFLMVTGIVWLIKKKKPMALAFLAGIIVIAPLASLISDEEYAVRTFIAVFALAILGACGMEQLIMARMSILRKKLLLTALGIIYICSFGLYLYRYHFLYVQYGREAWGGVNKDVFVEAYKQIPNYKHITFGMTSEFDYMEFMYWNKLPVTQMQHTLSTYDDKMLTYKNINFVRLCSFQGDYLYFGSLRDGELLYTHDTCFKDVEPLKRYYLPKTLIWLWKTYDQTSVKPKEL